MAKSMTRRGLCSYFLLIALISAAGVLSGAARIPAWATHGPPHQCHGKTITQVSLDQTTNQSDTILGTQGQDVVAGGLGEDYGTLGAGDDFFCGNEDNDFNLVGGVDRDIINGGDSGDTGNGNSGRDDLYGGVGPTS